MDQAVDAAQWLAETGITVARQLIETVYRLREDGYLKEQRGFEQFRDTARNVLNLSLQQLATLRAVAFTELTKADEQFQRQQQLIFASEAAHINDHYARWDAAYAKMKQDIADSQPTTEQILNGIQLTLDGLGFAPGVGAVPDVINAIISAGRGNFGEALFSLGAAVPLFGDIAKGGKMLAKGASNLHEVAAITSAVAKNGDKAKDILKAGKEAGGELQEYLAAVDDYLTHIDELKAAAKNGDQTAIDALRDMKNDELFGKFKHLIEEHHAWPKYLGGPVRQELVKMPTSLHKKYHELLDKIADRRKTKEYFDNLSKEERAALDSAFAELTKEFDKRYGTNLWDAVLRNGFPNQ